MTDKEEKIKKSFLGAKTKIHQLNSEYYYSTTVLQPLYCTTPGLTQTRSGSDPGPGPGLTQVSQLPRSSCPSRWRS